MKDLQRDYDHHPPIDEEDAEQHGDVRQVMKLLAGRLDGLVPDGREKSLMHTKLEEAMFWANAGIARLRYDDAQNVEFEESA